MDRKILASKFCFTLFSVLVMGLLGSCGSGGGSQTTVGTITGFGSVYVDKVRYDSTGTQIRSDDVDGEDEQALLSEGMVVTVTHDGNGHAESIHYENDLTGPVSAITDNGDGSKTLTILGVQVLVDPSNTHVDSDHGLTFDNIAVEDVIEVSGYADDGAGRINATYIEKEGVFSSHNDEMEVKGTLSAMTASSVTISLGDTTNISVTVDMDSATDIEDVPGGQLAVGMYVEAKGQLPSLNGQILASEIELETDDHHEDDDHNDDLNHS